MSAMGVTLDSVCVYPQIISTIMIDYSENYGLIGSRVAAVNILVFGYHTENCHFQSRVGYVAT